MKLKHCKDCEPAQEIHWLAYTSVVMNYVSQPFLDFMEFFFKRITEILLNIVSTPFLRLMVFLRLGYFADKADEKDTLRTKCFWLEAERRGIKMVEFHMGPVRDAFIAKYKNKTIDFDGLPRPEIYESDSVKWMDNKGIMKVKFQKESLPVANGGVAFTKATALKIFNSLEKPVIAKPNLGSRSRHTTIHINTKEDLLIAFQKAKKLSPLVVIEEELSGSLFRGTLIDGKLVGVVRRDPPLVQGDGVNTLQKLLEKENERVERNGPIFHKITLSDESKIELARQNMTLESIPTQGQIVTFSQKTSRGCGGTTTEVSDIVHIENIKMLEKLGAFLKDPLVGVDFIMQDITQPWQVEKHCGIIECNSLPFIDLHHYPLFGKPNNVAGKLWDLVMPESKID
ncbi:MAG: hypothetical protein WC822_02850 [Candidatus Paceibacterota bacterium]|jgi:cyanophycin synthetase